MEMYNYFTSFLIRINLYETNSSNHMIIRKTPNLDLYPKHDLSGCEKHTKTFVLKVVCTK